MVYSASAVWADYKFDDSFFFAKRQLLFAGIGVIAMFFIMNVDYWTWRTWSKLLMVICFFPSGACFDTGRRNGAERFKKLDRSRSIQHTAFRVYEACDDCIPC